MKIRAVFLKKKMPLFLKETSINLLYGFLCGIFFYNEITITIVLSAAFCFRGYIKGKKYEKKELIKINESHFYEFLIELSEGLDTGNNIINAICEIQKDLPEGRVKEKLNEAIVRFGYNYSLEDVFNKFSSDFSSDLIKNWSRVICLSYVNGADLQKAIRENRDLFILRRRTMLELRSIITKQKMNFLIIKFMPFVILFILVGFGSEFSQVLYSSQGRVIMSIALMLILISELISEKITKIC